MFELSKYIEPIKSSGNGIVFAPTNGVGLGHLTRTLSIAKRVKKLDPRREIIFFSTSPAMHLVLEEGFFGYHLPSKELFPKDTTPRQWDHLLQEHLMMIFKSHRPSVLVFDGAYPYNGLINSMKEAQLKGAWIKRHEYKGITESISIDRERYFNHIIKTREAGKHSLVEKNGYYYCDPPILLEEKELLDANEIRRQWKIPNEYKIVYVQLGAGNINDIKSTIYIILNILRKREDIFIVIGESIIGKRLNIADERIQVIRDYPNSRYFKAFDLAISAAGYNTYHELMHFGVPSILVPNIYTEADDQISRAMYAQNIGAAISLINPTEVDFEKAIEKALDPENNNKMKSAAKSLMSENGADQVAELLLQI
ncbi:glycosyltransferase [Alkalithermobacter paradoxus]|uniref:UDP-N-acetylglucosamine transferase n=1 Tax=Alkalithermobacter paradoxus TaxID=29349 RepID=A0A1V4I999_9FIRM|nr:UDP-N-acetylglucosamine transferase [[Clostridium] thermoalcaliphilum]